AVGIIVTVAGNGARGYSGDGGPAIQAELAMSTSHYGPLAVGPDGSLYIADAGNFRVRRVSAAFPGVSLTDFLIASEDGSEVYDFDSSGRHLRTFDAITVATRYQFSYDAAGRLIAIT